MRRFLLLLLPAIVSANARADSIVLELSRNGITEKLPVQRTTEEQNRAVLDRQRPGGYPTQRRQIEESEAEIYPAAGYTLLRDNERVNHFDIGANQVDTRANCAGMTLAWLLDGAYKVNPQDALDHVLNPFGRLREPHERVMPGDVGVFLRDGRPQHVVLVESVDADGIVIISKDNTERVYRGRADRFPDSKNMGKVQFFHLPWSDIRVKRPQDAGFALTLSRVRWELDKTTGTNSSGGPRDTSRESEQEVRTGSGRVPFSYNHAWNGGHGKLNGSVDFRFPTMLNFVRDLSALASASAPLVVDASASWDNKGLGWGRYTGIIVNVQGIDVAKDKVASEDERNFGNGQKSASAKYSKVHSFVVRPPAADAETALVTCTVFIRGLENRTVKLTAYYRLAEATPAAPAAPPVEPAVERPAAPPVERPAARPVAVQPDAPLEPRGEVHVYFAESAFFDDLPHDRPEWARSRSPEVLEDRIVGKMLRHFDRQWKLGRADAWRFYGETSARLASYGIDLGDDLSNRKESASHEAWAADRSPEQLKAALETKLRTVMGGAFIAGKYMAARAAR